MDNQKRTVRAGYDELAREYDAERTADVEHEGLERLRDVIGNAPRLLDLGCGGGRGPLQQLPSENAVGLDFSGEQLRLACTRTDAALVTGDMTLLPFAADSFEVVTAFYSVIHLPVEEHRECYAEVGRVLQPGGRFLFSIGDDWTGANDDWLETGTRMAWSFPPMAETERLLEEAGLSVEERFGVRSEMDDGEWPFLLCQTEPAE
ncbi:MAG: methyltransferase domain-containing protein [Halolamina sp.]|uniref:class I SAM-dependent methyltransferase n=1 Tax=Halolamina sp. TaxID=1940283 RepID=UPI002FC352C6